MLGAKLVNNRVIAFLVKRRCACYQQVGRDTEVQSVNFLFNPQKKNRPSLAAVVKVLTR